MKQTKYGIYAVNLGKSCEKIPDSVDLRSWKDALVIDHFYRAGGNPHEETPTKVLMKWTKDQLGVLFLNMEESCNVNQERSDSNELVLSSGNFGLRDFCVFTTSREGKRSAVREIGMTYIGGDKPFCTGNMDDPQKETEITDIDVEEYQSMCEKIDGGWASMFVIPWSLFGGFPTGHFYFQAIRRKWQTNEITCPAGLDLNIYLPYWYEYDPNAFIEAAIDGKAEIYRGESALVTLPSGALRWLRPVKIVESTQSELEQISEQLKILKPTDSKNVKEHVALAQRLQDVLYQEGVDYFWDEAQSRPFEHREPWLERRLFNEESFKGNLTKAYQRLDEFLNWYQIYISWWYADGTLGNQSDKWIPFDDLKEVFLSENEIMLDFEKRSILISFADNGMRVRSGGKGFFDYSALTPVLKNEADMIVAQADGSTVKISKGLEWSIRYAKENDNKEIIINKNTFRVLDAKGRDGYEVRLPLGTEESVYGFGERFDHVNQRGFVLSLWQRDCYSSIMAGLGNQAYKNIPLVHFSSGYSVFFNSTYRARADVGCSRIDELKMNIADPIMDLWFWVEKPIEVMQNYAKLTGMPLLPPKWVFEPWAGGGGGRWMNGPLKNIVEEQMGVIEKFAELDIPHTGFYAEGAGSGSKSVDIGAPYMISSFAESKGMHAFSWNFPVMPKEKAVELLGDDQNLPLMEITSNENNRPYPSYIDFTHPRAKDLLRAQWDSRLKAGIRGTMVDFGDLVPDEAKFYDGRSGKEMHNAYGYEYAKLYQEVFSEVYGEDHVLYQRCGTAGTQAFTCQFGGDQPTSFVGMEYSIHGGLSVAASGLPFWGVDCTGYDGPMTDDEAYIRWTEWGAFCPIWRYHGTTPREPWEHTEEAVRIYKYYAWLRENLLNYSYSTAIQAHQTGIPMMRILSMMFPDDTGVNGIEDEYMYGDHLLVAPVYSENAEKEVIFPLGHWVSLFDNREQIHNKHSVKKTVPLDEIPVYIHSGAVIPMLLNESLKQGISMTTSKVKVLLITKPYENSTGSWNGSDTEKNCYYFKVDEAGFSFEANGTREYKYVLVKGISKNDIDIRLNGRKLEKKPAKQGLNFHEAWCILEDGTIAIRMHMHSEIQISILES